MRKVLSFVLVLAMILGSVSMAFAASPTDVVGKDSEEAVNVLMEFGVVTGYPDGSFKPAGIVTRAEMAAFVIRALGLKPNASANTKFADVPSTHWASNYVAYATSLGIIIGRSATVFDPNATVSYDEAVTMLVRALGYTETSLQGVYPAAYVSKAKALGIIGDIQAGTAGANRGDIAQLVFNTLSCEIGMVDKDGIWEVIKIDGDADTMMARLGATKFDGGNGVGKEFVLTNAQASDAVADVRALVGAYVTAYQNSDKEIISIKEVKSVFLKGEFKDGKGVAATTFETDGLDYDITGNAYYTAKGLDLFNGKFTTGTSAAINSSTGEYVIAAKVSGVKVQDIYSVAKWTATDGFYFDPDQLTEKKMHGYAFKLDNTNKIDLSSFDLLGAASLKDIKKDDVVYVFMNGDITKIEVGTKTVSGVVTMVNTGATKFTIDGVEYKEGEKYEGTDPKAKDEVKLILDYAGKIFDVDPISSTTNLAVVMATKDGTSGSFGTTPEIELVLADGTSKIFKAKPSAIKNPLVISDAAVYGWASGGAVQSGKLIKYGLNADGVVTSITPLTEFRTVMGPVPAGDKVTATGYYNGLKIKSDATILVYDGAIANFVSTGSLYFGTTGGLDADNFDTATLSKILDTKAVRSYYTVNTGGQIDFMVMHSSGTTADTIYGVVQGAGTNTSADGFFAKLLVGEVESTVDAKADYNTFITEGALAKISYSATGVATLDNAFTGSLAATGTAISGGGLSSFALTINSNNVVKVNAALTGTGAFDADTADFTLASNVVVYKWNGSKYVAATKAELKDELMKAVFFDTGLAADRDGIVDVVLITLK